LIYERLTNDLDSRFDPDVYSGRVGKGLDKALVRAQALSRCQNCAYVWRGDIRKFFESVRHDVLRSLLGGHFMYPLCDQVIGSYGVGLGRGMPIGNLTSQIFANIYLNEFDRYVRNYIKPNGYIRYGDDVAMLFANRRAAYLAERQGREYLGMVLGLEINPKNTYIGVADKICFLGHKITADTICVDDFCVKKAQERANFRNLGSYKNLRLSPELKDLLDRKILSEIETCITHPY